MFAKSRFKRLSPVGLSLFFFFGCVLSCHLGFGQQFAFGPIIQIYQPSVRGGAEAGDVVILSDPTTPSREPSFGVFVSRSINPYLQLSLSVNYSQQFYSFTVFNQAEQCTFCPVRKSAGLAINNFDVSTLLKLRFLNLGKFKFLIVGGASIQLRTEFRPNERTNVSFGNNHPGVADIINQMDDVHEPVGLYLSYGAAVQYGRLMLQLVHQNMMSKSFADDLYLNTEWHTFNVDVSYFTLSLQYHLHSFRVKKSQRDKTL